MVLLERVTVHLVNGGQLNPNFQGERLSVDDPAFSQPKKMSNLTFPMTGQ